MSPRSFLLTPELQAYVSASTTALDEVALALIEETAALGGVSGMQLAPDQGMFLQVIAAAVGATRAVEVGTFTGFSALCLARGMGPSGRLTCCDVSEEWTAVARRFWERAGVADRIDLRIAPGAETIAALPAEPHLDLVFIDADKGGYATYVELLVPRLRPGGLLLLDNTLWSGRVADPATAEGDTLALIELNKALAVDERLEVVLLTIGDGLTLARKR